MWKTISISLLSLTMVLSGWSIGSEGRKPGEKPSWWNTYDNHAPTEVSPDVQSPVGEVKQEVQEAVTTNSPVKVPDTLVVKSVSADQETDDQTAKIDGKQVMKEASKNPDGKRGFSFRPIGWFSVFLIVGISAVFGVFRWLNAQSPPPPTGKSSYRRSQ